MSLSGIQMLVPQRNGGLALWIDGEPPKAAAPLNRPLDQMTAA